MYFKTMDGEEMATNKKNFIEDNNPRSSATWESALEELIGREWVKGIGQKGEIFKVTREGYEIADLLQV